MPNLRKTLLDAAARLGGDEAVAEARILLEHASGRSSSWLYLHADDELDAELAARYEDLLAQRQNGVPIPYLTGTRGFWTLDLDVTSDVLIPRPETELLVELALQRIPQADVVDVADLGTGSGAIALALASERPQARVIATDASRSALAVASANAARLGLARVEFAHGDWCDALPARRYALIASNPPYIALGDAHLQQGDLRFEPAAALSSGIDGLDAIRRISNDANQYLLDGGWLLFEHGWDQGQAVRAVLEAAGFVDVATYRDLGDRDRVSLGRWYAEARPA